ncbi:MAG: serine/threonine-protein kinase [Planctomycetes bacterium]|nr:serine/threonine-protein kinase [Planctomycetota bacterium]
MTWREVRATFERLVELPPADRASALAEFETRDPASAAEVRALLVADSASGGFLERDHPPTTSSAPRAGDRLGRFELVRPLGSGGMGLVWEAKQTQPERRVALKILTSSAWSRAERWRFEYEAQVLAGLNHASIAQLFEAGTETQSGGEIAWFAMELVEDARDLVTAADERRLDRDARLALFAELCEAVQYGHRRGVIHRDLKPANVLVGRDGRLKLIDFGVARAVEGSSATPSLRTHTGELVGTLQYMAPEQVAGRNDEIDARCDVYALGVILFRLIAGADPFDFRGASLARVAELVATAEPRRPSALRADLAGDLEWILLRALEKDPARRYQSVADLAQDLRRFREHEPVAAHAPSLAYRVRKYLRRHRAAAAIVAALVLGVALAIGGLVSGMRKARAGEQAAQSSADESARQTVRAEREATRNRQVLQIVEHLFDGVEDTIAGRDVKVADLLDAATLAPGAIEDPSVEFTLRAVRGLMYCRLRLYSEAKDELERAVELFPRLEGTKEERERWLASRAFLGSVWTRTGRAADGEAEMRAAIDLARVEGFAGVQVDAGYLLCVYLIDKGNPVELLEESRALAELAVTAGARTIAFQTEGLVAMALQDLGEVDEAVPVLEKQWHEAVAMWGETLPRPVTAFFNYADALQRAGRLDEAEALYPRLLELSLVAHGPTHDQTLTILNNRAMLSVARGNLAEAAARLRELVAAYDTRGFTPTSDHLVAINNLGMVLNVSGDQLAAEPVLRRVADLSRELLAPDDVNGMLYRLNHGACLAWLKRWPESEPILLAEYEALQRALPTDHESLRKAFRTIGDAYAANGEAEKAAAWRAQR